MKKIYIASYWDRIREAEVLFEYTIPDEYKIPNQPDIGTVYVVRNSDGNVAVQYGGDIFLSKKDAVEKSIIELNKKIDRKHEDIETIRRVHLESIANYRKMIIGLYDQLEEENSK